MNIPDSQYDALVHRIYNINEKDFEGVAVDVWKYQFANNPTYRAYCTLLNISSGDIKGIQDIPYLPISTFKNHIIKTGDWSSEAVFRSSGTTGSIQSQHHVRDLDWYHRIAANGFRRHFKAFENAVWLGLLPSYLDRPDSSLVDMVNTFVSAGGQKESGFYPTVDSDLVKMIEALSQQKEKVILIGVTFALLDLFEQFKVPVWNGLLVLETGGMKGRGMEITREEVYQRLRKNHRELIIGSEYGMTELLSQAYKTKENFVPGPQMKVSIRDISDPFSNAGLNQRGVINIIDLANVDTCAFIATDDIGLAYADGSFDVLGRLDNSDLRGCNLLYA
jgi:phenylacetate-coenzyme A ligase PaaK-like adenylate-forming protein